MPAYKEIEIENITLRFTTVDDRSGGSSENFLKKTIEEGIHKMEHSLVLDVYGFSDVMYQPVTTYINRYVVKKGGKKPKDVEVRYSGYSGGGNWSVSASVFVDGDQVESDDYGIAGQFRFPGPGEEGNPDKNPKTLAAPMDVAGPRAAKSKKAKPS